MTEQSDLIEQIDDLLLDADQAFEDGDLETCIEAAQKVLTLSPGVTAIDPELAKECQIDANLILGNALDQIGEPEDALAAFAAALELEPNAPDALLGQGRILLDAWQLEDAKATLALAASDSNPEVLGPIRKVQAVILELEDRGDEAAKLHAEAASLDPEGCPLPTILPDEEAYAILDGIVESLPEDLQAALENVVFDVVGLPDPQIDDAPNSPPTVLGLYSGTPIGERESSADVLPAMIRIFKRNLELIGLTDKDELQEQLRITILHEIGHHLGWDEDDLAERGLA